MTIHCLRGIDVRDVVPGTTGSYANFVLLAMFLTGVLDFKLVGSSNASPMNGPNMLTLPTAGAVTGTMLDFSDQRLYMSGTRGVIDIPLSNMPIGSGIHRIPELVVSSSLMYQTVPDSIIGYVGIRSQNNGLVNSGIYKTLELSYSPGFVATAGSVTGTYRIIFDPYLPLASGTLPLDTNFSWKSVSYIHDPSRWLSGSTFSNNESFVSQSLTYHGSSSSVSLRAIYESPHSTKWQVRLAIETLFDRTTLVCPAFTVAPGVSGSSTGDFLVRGPHLHVPQWYDSIEYRRFTCTTIGLDPVLNYGAINGEAYVVGGTGQLGWKFYAWGDDETGSTVILNRNVQGAFDGFLAFGLPEDEELPLPNFAIQRLFCIGNAAPLHDNFRNRDPINWIGSFASNGSFNRYHNSGLAYSIFTTDMSGGGGGGPIGCVLSTLNYVSYQPRDNEIITDTAAGDSPFTKSTELIPVELIAGTCTTFAMLTFTSNQFPDVLPIEPRRLGRFPIARYGRANLPSWSKVGTASWAHIRNGVYFPWGNIGAP